jgi:DNA-binding response OmpR family regulator
MRRPSCVLIADDDADIRELVAMVLRQAGFHATPVEGGRDALAAAAEEDEAPNLYVLDVRMPDVSGLDVCRALRSREDTARRPIMLISAETSPEDVAAAYAAGADLYLPKPFSPRELVRRVDELLARPD